MSAAHAHVSPANKARRNANAAEAARVSQLVAALRANNIAKFDQAIAANFPAYGVGAVKRAYHAVHKEPFLCNNDVWERLVTAIRTTQDKKEKLKLEKQLRAKGAVCAASRLLIMAGYGVPSRTNPAGIASSRGHVHPISQGLGGYSNSGLAPNARYAPVIQIIRKFNKPSAKLHGRDLMSDAHYMNWLEAMHVPLAELQQHKFKSTAWPR